MLSNGATSLALPLVWVITPDFNSSDSKSLIFFCTTLRVVCAGLKDSIDSTRAYYYWRTNVSDVSKKWNRHKRS